MGAMKRYYTARTVGGREAYQAKAWVGRWQKRKAASQGRKTAQTDKPKNESSKSDSSEHSTQDYGLFGPLS